MMVAASLLVLEAWAQQGLAPVLSEEPNYSKSPEALTSFTALCGLRSIYLAYVPPGRLARVLYPLSRL